MRMVCQQILRAAPHLDDPKFRPLLRSFAQITILIEKSYGAVMKFPSLVSETTGELRGSLQTLGQLISHQRRLLADLGLTPATVAQVAKEVKPMLDLAAMRDVE